MAIKNPVFFLVCRVNLFKNTWQLKMWKQILLFTFCLGAFSEKPYPKIIKCKNGIVGVARYTPRKIMVPDNIQKELKIYLEKNKEYDPAKFTIPQQKLDLYNYLSKDTNSCPQWWNCR